MPYGRGSRCSRPEKGCSSEEYPEGFHERLSALMGTWRALGRAGLGRGRSEAIRNVYCDFRSPAASRARSWRRLRRCSQRPAAWLAAIRHFG
jgi:hypothetical protein